MIRWRVKKVAGTWVGSQSRVRSPTASHQVAMEAPLEKQGSMRVYNSHLMDSLLKDEDEVSPGPRRAPRSPITPRIAGIGLWIDR